MISSIGPASPIARANHWRKLQKKYFLREYGGHRDGDDVSVAVKFIAPKLCAPTRPPSLKEYASATVSLDAGMAR